MVNSPGHPGEILKNVLIEKNISQRIFSFIIGIPPTTLNSFITGDKSVSADLAVKLEAANLGITAKKWMYYQVIYDLNKAKSVSSPETNEITAWSEIQERIPTKYFTKNGLIGNDRSKNIKAVLNTYDCADLPSFIEKIDSYPFKHFRKSSAFQEKRNNVVAWSILAEFEASKIKLKNSFDSSESSKVDLIQRLNEIFKNNHNVFSKTKKVLSDFGIKFSKLDRPSSTPVDGKSFMSGENPAIVVSLKYKRIDNFAFNVMHELGHVYLHLANKEYQGESFYTGNTSNDILEFEADAFARNALIPTNKWEEFILSHNEFFDEDMISFANEIGSHPAIVRGRVCFEDKRYYRRKSNITDLNYIG